MPRAVCQDSEGEEEDILYDSPPKSTSFSEIRGQIYDTQLGLFTQNAVLQQDFANHDPNVLFGGTGSTNAFGVSTLEHMIEQAQVEVSRQEPDTATINPANIERQDSSSFPWTVSAGPTQSPKSRPSPTVEIHRSEISEATLMAAVAPSTEKPTRGRKRKSSADAVEAPTSDDKVLPPKEQYNPRPSRRRATQIPEDAIDYSVVPEKAAKKRRKTADDILNSTSTKSGIVDDAALTTDSLLQATTSQTVRAEAESEKAQKAKTPSPLNEPDPDQQAETTSKAAPAFTPLKDGHAADSPAQANEKSQQPNKPSQPNQDPALSQEKLPSTSKTTSMAPPPLPPASSKKSRRSKTTIFEDHVSSRGSQKSPSLSQQQASRKKALKEVKNNSTQSTRPKTRKVIMDEDDEEEDELAKEDTAAEKVAEKSPPKKKRGRQPKAADKAKTKAKSTEPEREDSEAEAEPDDLDEEAEEEGEPPKKKQGGRPKKAKAAEQPTTDAAEKTGAADASQEVTIVAEKITIPSSDVAAVNQNGSSPAKAALERKDSNRQVSKSSAKSASVETEETPAPEKAATKKPDPSSHSPLKSSSAVPLRVGLSKKRRIPSLLKTFKPPPKASTR